MLKPCPKCKGTVITIWRIFGTRRYFCECHGCHYCGKTKTFLARAKMAWNKEKRR